MINNVKELLNQLKYHKQVEHALILHRLSEYKKEFENISKKCAHVHNTINFLHDVITKRYEGSPKLMDCNIEIGPIEDKTVNKN